MTTNTSNTPRPQPRISPGPQGRAVYLADVVRGLMLKHEATRAQVVNDHLSPWLDPAACAGAPAALYLAKPGGDADVMGGDLEWFSSLSGTRRKGLAQRGGQILQTQSKSLGKGAAGAVAWLRACWGNPSRTDADTLDHPASRAGLLAVSAADAWRCWAWSDGSMDGEGAVGNLAWLDAKADCPGVFSPDLKDWPGSMTAEQAAALQRPSSRGDKDGASRRRTLAKAITGAIEVGRLAAQDVTYFVKVETEASQRAQQAWKAQQRTGRESFNYNFRACGPGGPQRTYDDEQRTRKEIGAAAFVAWLQSQGDEPSAHVRAWEKAMGEAAAAPASVFPLADWSALVVYRKASTKNGRAPSWAPGNQIDIGKAELKRRQDAGATESDALNGMGVDLGLKATAGRTVLKRALFGERKRGKAAKGQQAQALPTTTVRDGKKAA